MLLVDFLLILDCQNLPY